MKDFITTIPLKNCLLLLLIISFGYLNCSAQEEQIDEIITDDMPDFAIDEVTNELTDTDNDGVPDEADLCPNTKGDLKYYGCLAESEDYIWLEETYEAYPARTTLEVKPAKFDTIAEQYLIKPAHNEGAVFEAVTEQVVVKEACSRLEVMESDFLKTEREILIDELTNKTIKIESFELATPPSTKEVAIPTEYKTLTRHKVVENGTGTEIAAEYGTYTKHVLVAPTSVKEVVVPAIKKVVKIRSWEPEKNSVEEEPEIYTIAREMPKFPGGDEELFKYFTSIVYPAEAKANKIEGTVVLGFTIIEDGSLQDFEVIRDIGGGCGEEALRLAKLMPNWLPGKQFGKPVKVAFKLPVRFRLEGNKKNKWFNRR